MHISPSHCPPQPSGAAAHVIEVEPELCPCVPPQEELRHFETKVEKHNHYQEQLELSHQKLQHVEALGDKEHIRKTQDKYHTLAEKTKEIGYKVGATPGCSATTLQHG